MTYKVKTIGHVLSLTSPLLTVGPILTSLDMPLITAVRS